MSQFECNEQYFDSLPFIAALHYTTLQFTATLLIGWNWLIALLTKINLISSICTGDNSFRVSWGGMGISCGEGCWFGSSVFPCHYNFTNYKVEYQSKFAINTGNDCCFPGILITIWQFFELFEFWETLPFFIIQYSWTVTLSSTFSWCDVMK